MMDTAFAPAAAFHPSPKVRRWASQERMLDPVFADTVSNALVHAIHRLGGRISAGRP
jgi:hypothetical protein